MKILHVGDMAGSAAIMSNICNKLGHESMVLQDINIETYFFGNYYGNTRYCKDVKDLLEQTRKLRGGFDHIIYHDQSEIASAMDSDLISSSYVFHGNMLRQNPKLGVEISNLDSIDNIFVTTEDMFRFIDNAELLWRPVDRELFKPLDRPRRPTGLCLTQERYFQEIKKRTQGRELGIYLVDRIINKIPYAEMPAVLTGYAGYYDFKFQPTHPPTLIPELSGTALQALSCGIPVYSNGLWYNIFPQGHDDENAARSMIGILEE